MKKLVALIFTLVLSLGLVAPVLAWTGITGQVIDGKNFSPWQWGGDVLVVDKTDNIVIATCILDSAGNIVESISPLSQCDYGSDALFTPGAAASTDGHNIEVIIDLSCAISGSCSGAPEANPDPIKVLYVEASPLGSQIKALGTIPTNSGPNAVQLVGMNGASGVGVALVLAMVAGGSLLVKSKVNNQPDSAYAVPEVIYEGVLEVQAGSPLGDISEHVLPDDLL